ncbi:unnamed protein product [Euphydryas editha]|uniref:Uncharacterized protein n=1 Tax=Euphydryas editha TaxID=104508 RepID=A0AAU9UCJ5_EUPED|nr:unnamed protein product [Euphydryas editha]
MTVLYGSLTVGKIYSTVDSSISVLAPALRPRPRSPDAQLYSLSSPTCLRETTTGFDNHVDINKIVHDMIFSRSPPCSRRDFGPPEYGLKTSHTLAVATEDELPGHAGVNPDVRIPTGSLRPARMSHTKK